MSLRWTSLTHPGRRPDDQRIWLDAFVKRCLEQAPQNFDPQLYLLANAARLLGVMRALKAAAEADGAPPSNLAGLSPADLAQAIQALMAAAGVEP